MTLHGIVQTAQLREQCSVCGCQPGEACRCAPGVHLCRIALAAHDGHITQADLVSVLYDADVFTGASIVLDGEAA